MASQLSECSGAGTGCGWCIPFLKQLHRQAVEGGETTELEEMTPKEYERRRAAYVRAGKGTPPAGAMPLPPKRSRNVRIGAAGAAVGRTALSANGPEKRSPMLHVPNRVPSPL